MQPWPRGSTGEGEHGWKGTADCGVVGLADILSLATKNTF